MEHLTEQEIAQCADALTSGKYDELPEQIKKHLASCDDCVHEVSMVADFSEKIKLMHPKSENKKFWLITSSVAAVIAILVIGNTILNKPQIAEQQITAQAPVKQENAKLPSGETTQTERRSSVGETPASVQKATTVNKKEELLAYAPNDNLEKLAQNFSGTYRGADITVITAHEFNCSTTDSLRWSNPDNIRLTVEFYNNKGIKSHTIISSGNHVALPAFTPGLYYWKLINDDFDLLFCGKLIIR